MDRSRSCMPHDDRASTRKSLPRSIADDILLMQAALDGSKSGMTNLFAYLQPIVRMRVRATLIRRGARARAGLISRMRSATRDVSSL